MVKVVFMFVFTAAMTLAVSAAGIGNGGFEDKGSWRIVGGELKDGIGMNGSRGLYLKNDDPVKGCRAWQFVRVEAGKSYKLSYMTKAVITKTGKYNIGASSVLVFHGDKKVVKRQNNEGLTATSDGWVKKEIVFTVPAGLRAFELQFVMTHGFCGEAFFDDVSLEEVAE